MSAGSRVWTSFDQPATRARVLRGQVDGLLEAFAAVADPRKPGGRRFALPVVLGLAQLAVACGAVGFDEIAEVAADLDPALTASFGLVRKPPSSVSPGAIRICSTRGSSHWNDMAAALGTPTWAIVVSPQRAA